MARDLPALAVIEWPNRVRYSRLALALPLTAVPPTAAVQRERPLWHKAPQAERSVLRVPVRAISR